MVVPHFGVTLPQVSRTWQDAKMAALECEQLGFDSLWACDHLYGSPRPENPVLEGWTLLSALGAITERVELGMLVSPPGFRNPAHFAKIIATLDHITNGRVVPGLGAGWAGQEFVSYGYDFPEPRVRLEQLAETAELLRHAWAEPDLTFTGQYYRTDHLTIAPPPMRRPPLLIGGGGEQVTMRIAARYADIWNNFTGDQPRLDHKVRVLHAHCRAVGRDPATIQVSQQALVVIAEAADEVAALLPRAAKRYGGNVGDVYGPLALSGTPAVVAERIEGHLTRGCTHFVLDFFGRDPLIAARLFAQTVLPRFRD